MNTLKSFSSEAGLSRSEPTFGTSALSCDCGNQADALTQIHQLARLSNRQHLLHRESENLNSLHSLQPPDSQSALASSTSNISWNIPAAQALAARELRRTAPSSVDPLTGVGHRATLVSATAEDEYLVGDWNGDGKDDLAVRRGSTILKDINGDGRHDLEQVFGLGNAENQYLVGDWNGDGKDDLAVRRGSTILMDINGDGRHDLQQTFGRGNRENQYLIGDWNGDGIDDIAVRRGSMVLVDVNRDGNRDLQQTFGLGASEAQYLVGDWNGDGKDDLAVRRGSTVLKDINGDGRHDLSQSFGLGGGEDQYLVGDWNRDGKDDIAVRRGSTVLMDINGDSRHDLQQTFGLGTAKPPAVSPVSPPPSEPANYTALSPKPRRTSINQGLLSPSPSFMESILGRPGALTNSCSLVTNSKLRRLLVTQDVGPITVTGLRPAVETLGAIFAQVRREKPKLYSQIGSAGMLCVRRVRGGSGFSNHSWGTAIDITINKRLDTFGDDRTQLGLKVLYPYFHKAGFYWGAGFSNREDSMHFEASRQLIQQWRSQRRI